MLMSNGRQDTNEAAAWQRRMHIWHLTEHYRACIKHDMITVSSWNVQSRGSPMSMTQNTYIRKQQ